MSDYQTGFFPSIQFLELFLKLWANWNLKNNIQVKIAPNEWIISLLCRDP